MKTVKSADARNNWREILAAARRGDTTVIEHYNRRVARVVPYDDPAVPCLVDELIEAARRRAEKVRSCSVGNVYEHFAALQDAEDTLCRVVHRLYPWGRYRDHFLGVRIATREHWLPELKSQDLPWSKVIDAEDIERFRRLGALTHAELVAACEYFGIIPPDEPVTIEKRLEEWSQHGDDREVEFQHDDPASDAHIRAYDDPAMTTYRVAWGLDEAASERQRTRLAETAEALRAALEAAAREPRPQAVDLYPVDDDSTVLQIGLGHPARSFALWFRDDPGTEDDGGYAVEPGCEPPCDSLTFDYGGEPSTYPPRRCRISPQTAFRLAEEFLQTGRRPESVTWDPEA